MNATRSLFVSVGIHLFLAIFFFAVVMMAEKAPLREVERSVVKIMVDRPQPSPSLPEEPTPLPQEKTVQPTPPAPQIQKPTPPKKEVTAIPEATPQKLTPTPPAPAAQPTATVEVKTPPPPKAAEPAPHVVVKPSPPPPPKAEKNYAEENLHRIRAILAERLKYPKNAVRLRQQGVCVVTFTLSSEKEVSQIVVSESSGFELLDDAAKALIANAAADFPKPSKTVRISVPIEYKLR
jgi:periplasmic protein TonB